MIRNLGNRMSDELWYYADRSHQQQGPVSADSLRALHAMKAVDAATLVWRDGLAAWVPLAQVGSELGIEVANAPPLPARTAASAARPVVVKPSSSGAWLVAAIAIGIIAVVVIGIFAAIAIPAYNDYSVRAKVIEAYASVSPLKLTVQEAWMSDETCPENGDNGIGKPDSYATETIAEVNVGTYEEACAIQILFKGFATGTEGEEILMTMDEAGQWHASSTLPDRLVPASMRD